MELLLSGSRPPVESTPWLAAYIAAVVVRPIAGVPGLAHRRGHPRPPANEPGGTTSPASAVEQAHREHRARTLAAPIRVLGDFELAEDALTSPNWSSIA
jgi:hypothetical protein